MPGAAQIGPWCIALAAILVHSLTGANKCLRQNGNYWADVGISFAFYNFCRGHNSLPLYACNPRSLGESQGTSGDDHPFADIRNGQAFVNQVYNAVTNSPA